MRPSFQRGSRYFILFMALSFLGWAAETIFFLFCYGRFYDRGFMTLPFCPIYGFSFLIAYFLIGSWECAEAPFQEGRKTVRIPGCFLLCALVPTGLELITGYGFHQLFGIRLWDYSAYRFHFRGYICLEYTLLWGILLPFCIKWVFIPLKKRVFEVSAPCVRVLSVLLALLAAGDLALQFSRQVFAMLA